MSKNKSIVKESKELKDSKDSLFSKNNITIHASDIAAYTGLEQVECSR
jgi:hypothetical protein